MDTTQKNHGRLDFWAMAWFTGASLAVGLSAVVLRRRRKCSLCRGRIEGELESTQLSIVCKKCTLQYFKSNDASDEYLYIMSENDAIHKSGCIPADLSRINSSFDKFENGCFSKKESYYLRSEVLFLRNQRRKEKVESALGLRLKDVHPVVRHFLLGDYLTLLTESKTKLEDVLVYKDVTQQASVIVKYCRWAHPQAVLDFCVENPTAGPREFEKMRHKIEKVLLLEGRRILHGLSSCERKLLKDGALEDVYEAFYAEESNNIIRGYLIQWFNATTVEKIMADDGWVSFDWATGPEDRTATHLKAFWIEKLNRKVALEKALQERSLPMPDSCNYCRDYINGTGELELPGVVACVDLARRLMTLGIEKDAFEWEFGFDAMFHSLRVLKKEPGDSVKMAIDAVIEELESQNQDSDEDVGGYY